MTAAGKKFVEVAVPVPLLHTFTYALPPEMAPLVEKGCRLLVPFGTKLLSGIALGFSETASVPGIKPVRDILSASPVLSEKMLALADWMTKYYCAPPGEVLRSLLPQGLTTVSKREARLIKAPSPDELHELKSSASQAFRVLTELLSTSRMTASALQKKTGVKNIGGVLAELERRGFVRVEEELGHGASAPKVERFVQRIGAVDSAMLKGAKQQLLLERINGLPDAPYAVLELLKETGASLATLRSLVEKGIISIVEREVERREEQTYDEPPGAPIVALTTHQSTCLQELNAALAEGKHTAFLLHGVTGSGKTQVYIEAIRTVLTGGKTAIVLVPEISLTPQIVRRFRFHFGDQVIVMHSRMSPGERYDAWRYTLEGKYKIAIGPRSALFAPMKNLGLIVVDEEHESSYKQFDSSPRYNARDLAIVRGTLERAVVILGSATPSLESYYNALEGKYRLLRLPERIDGAVMPEIAIVNMGDEQKRRFAAMKERAKEIGKQAFEGGFHSISKLMEDKIRDRLSKKEGIILLQNRRGFAPVMECPLCGHVDRCESCDVTMTYHLTKKHLRCHYCGMVKPLPELCPACKGGPLKMQGFGTQRVEQDLATLFPDARVLRMDLDTTTERGAHQSLLQKFAHGEADILLGTQMVAKGLDFPHVSLVGVISADTQMLLPDFRSAERTFQLLTQVAGRAGRSTLRGEVVIQSYQTDHYALKHVLKHDYEGFYAEELKYRKETFYPPFSRIVLLEFRGLRDADVQSIAQQTVALIRKEKRPVTLLGPAAAAIAKIQNQFRWHVIVKALRSTDPGGAAARAAVAHAVQQVSRPAQQRGVRILVDVDPQGIL